MICPRCKQHDTCVIDSRELDPGAIRRRRECGQCQYRFTTYERVEALKLGVEKKDGTVQPYNREKLASGIRLATEKRGIDAKRIEELLDNIEQELLKDNLAVIPSSKIGKATLKYLKNLDEVAYVRFSSVYKEFSSIKSFEKELAKLGQNK